MLASFDGPSVVRLAWAKKVSHGTNLTHKRCLTRLLKQQGNLCCEANLTTCSNVKCIITFAI